MEKSQIVSRKDHHLTNFDAPLRPLLLEGGRPVQHLRLSESGRARVHQLEMQVRAQRIADEDAPLLERLAGK